MTKRYHIVFPEENYVTAEQLIQWAKDDVANRKTTLAATQSEVRCVEDAIAILHDSGTVTVSTTPETP